MKPATRKAAKREPMEENFRRFATALMAVPKKELDKEPGKRDQATRKKPKRREP